MHEHEESNAMVDWAEVLELVMSAEHWIYEGVSSIVGFILYTIALAIWLKFHHRKRGNASTED